MILLVARRSIKIDPRALPHALNGFARPAVGLGKLAQSSRPDERILVIMIILAPLLMLRLYTGFDIGWNREREIFLHIDSPLENRRLRDSIVLRECQRR